jgi:hypothetical protein
MIPWPEQMRAFADSIACERVAIFNFSLRLFRSRLAPDGINIVATANKVNSKQVVSGKIVEKKQKPRKTQGFLLGKEFLVSGGQDCQSHRRVDF